MSFPTLADDLEELQGGGVRARVLYLDDTTPGQSLGTTPVATPANDEPWVYLEFDITPTSVSDPAQGVPESYALSQNYPNPFNPSTKITYALPTKADVSLKVYNVLGQEAASLVNEFQEAGTYNVDFSAAKLTSGVYFYTLKAGQFAETKKMMLLK